MLRSLFTVVLLGHVLEAEARRPPPPADFASADPFALIVGVCCVMAYFIVKFAFKISATKGYQAITVCLSIGVAAMAYPTLWSVCAVAVPAFVLSYLLRSWRT